MKAAVLLFVLLGALVLTVQARPEPEPEPEPEPAKAGLRPQFRAATDVDVEVVDEKEMADDAANPSDASSGRLFAKKFLLFKNLFSGQQTQPIIPIIIAGGTGGGITSPATSPATSPTSTTLTSTGTIPNASGTITTTPTNRARESYGQEEQVATAEAAAIDEEALPEALIAGAQEYVVTDEQIKGTADAKATRQPNRVNLRRKNGKKGQVVSVRIPPQYRRYFKNGQKVMLNTNNRPLRRRVGPKRVQRVRWRKGGKNKRRVGGI